jgi:signal transduction histidine kinase
MRISAKIISGYGILIALMAGLLVIQFVTIDLMRKSINTLTDVTFESAFTLLELKADHAEVLYFTKLSFEFPKSNYPSTLKKWTENFEAHLADIKMKSESKASSNREKEAIERLSKRWSEFSEELALQEQDIKSLPAAQGASDVLLGLLEQIGIEIESVNTAIRDGIKKAVTEVRDTKTAAVTFSYLFAAIALISSGLVSFFIAQSISRPLRQLTQGTRTIAEGKFSYRLDTTRHDEFAQLAKDFNTMTLRLDELDRMKKDFVSHVSHELKAPLASMQETIRLLLEQIPGPLNDKQRRLLELNLASGRRLSTMIGNLLDLSRFEAGVVQYELKSNDLVGLVRTAAADLGPYAGEKDLSVKIEAPEQPIMVECDGDRIMQIIKNLLSNAIQFSPKGKEIRVRVSRSPEMPAGMPESWRSKVASPTDGKEFVLVTVTDFGPGVPDQHKRKIFERFHQVKQGKKLPGQSVGLGLAISRTIAEAHRGAIWVRDNPEGGSIFFLLLPPGEGSSQVSYRASLAI